MRIYFMSIFASVAALAVQVPQDSVDKYYFSTPNVPSNITGNVIGDGTPSYSVLRSEDIAWLHEAYAERVGLLTGWSDAPTNYVEVVPTFGKWPLSETNRFYSWTTATEALGDGAVATNVIIGYNVVTNTRKAGIDSVPVKSVDPAQGLNVGSVAANYLITNDGAYVSRAFSFEKGDRDHTYFEVTNITQETLSVDAWSNCVTTIEMAMTNGTTSVYTNSWTVYAPSNVTVTVTNIVKHYETDVDLIFTNGVFARMGRKYPGMIKGLLDNANFTNHYAFLENCKRFLKTGPYSTNFIDTAWTQFGYIRRTPASSADYYDIGSGTYDFYSNPFLRIHASDGTGNSLTRTNDLDRGTWGWVKEYSFASGANSSQRATGTKHYRIAGREAIPDGKTITIKCAKMYAIAQAEYYESSWSGNGSPDDVPAEYVASNKWTVVLPMASPTFYSPDGSNVYFDVSWQNSFYDDVWAATSAPEPLPSSATWLPSIRFNQASDVIPEPWPESYGPYYKQGYSGSTSTSKGFEISLSHLYLLIDAEPLTSLPGWHE